MPQARPAQDPAPVTASAASADGVRVVFETAGEGGTPLVFVHGWSSDRRYWSWQVRGFGRHQRVVAIDLAGHGESGGGRQAWTMAAYGDDVAAVVRALDLKGVVLVGHSMGGDVIAEAARRLKGRVSGLVFVDTYKQLDAARTPDEIAAITAPFRADFCAATRNLVKTLFPAGADPQLVDMVAADMSMAPPAVGLPSLEAALRYDREMPLALAELKLPAVAINPEQPPTDIPSMRRHGVQVMQMSDVGHFPMMESPERFNRMLRAAIEQILD